MNRHLSTALYSILRSLMGLMVRKGVSFGDVTKLLKRAYIEETEKELLASGEKPTTSRIAIITGLTRKDVAALRKEDSPSLQHSAHHNRAVRVISGWISDSEYCNEDGNASVLDIQGDSGSFETLVAKYSGDMPYRAILKELIRTGAVEQIGNNKVVLVRSAYLSTDDENDKYALLGEDVSLLISTIKHNIITRTGQLRYQRKVSYDRIPKENVAQFIALANRENQLLLIKLNSWLAKHDLDKQKKIKPMETMKIGVGVYYFEEPAKNSEEK